MIDMLQPTGKETMLDFACNYRPWLAWAVERQVLRTLSCHLSPLFLSTGGVYARTPHQDPCPSSEPFK